MSPRKIQNERLSSAVRTVYPTLEDRIVYETRISPCHHHPPQAGARPSRGRALHVRGRTPCVDLAQQLHAVESAISNAKRELIHDHIEHCLDDNSDAPKPARGAQGTQSSWRSICEPRFGARISRLGLGFGTHGHSAWHARRSRRAWPHARRDRCDDRRRLTAASGRSNGRSSFWRSPRSCRSASWPFGKRGAARGHHPQCRRCNDGDPALDCLHAGAAQADEDIHLWPRPGRRSRRHHHRPYHSLQRDRRGLPGDRPADYIRKR